MVQGHRIKRKISIEQFSTLIKNYSSENISCTDHTFFRLSEKQRKLLKCETIKNYILDKKPVLAGIQYNNCYTVFYKYENKRFIRIVLDISVGEIDIVTFYIIDKNQVPQIK